VRSWQQPRNIIKIAALALVAGVAIWAFAIEPNRLVVHREELAVAVARPLRVALLSDLHAGGRFIDAAKVHAVVEAVASEKPDLILLLGDYLNNGRSHRFRLAGGPSSPEAVAAELGRLHAPLGVYAVLGNHDWWFDGRRIAAALAAEGITVLENRAVEARPGLWLAGISDKMTRHPDIAAALAGVPAGATVLAMTHNPDIFPGIPGRVALTVAGHTHGGQVRLPGVGAPVVPSQYGRRYAAGHVVEDGRHLFVTTGVGTSIYAVRMGVPPEVVVLTLTPPR
jgi:predicted MPP superfamily phosphohydrolase